jgi:hypothetical protein
MLAKPQKDEDVRYLHRYVAALVEGINARLDMTVRVDGRAKGGGKLVLHGNKTDLKIYSSGGELGGEGGGGVGGGLPPEDVTVTVISSDNPSDFHEAIHFTATVTAVQHVPTGVVQFKVDNANLGSPVALDSVGGADSPTTSTLTIGDHDVVAFYPGDLHHNPGSSVVLKQHVSGAATVTVASTLNPCYVGQSVHWTVHVHGNGPVPQGTVTVTIDNVLYGTWTLDANGDIRTNPRIFNANQSGPHTIRAHYNGTNLYPAADGALTQNVTPLINPAVSVTSSQNPASVNTTISWQADVSNGGTGTIQFLIDGVNFGGPVALDAGGQALSAGKQFTDAGSHQIVANYSGDFARAPATGSMQQDITGNVLITVTASENPTGVGRPIFFEVTVQKVGGGTPVPTGTVVFYLDTTLNFETGTLNSSGYYQTGTHSFGTGTQGSHTITVHYNGDGTYNPADGTLTVNVKGLAGLELQLVPNPIHYYVEDCTATAHATQLPGFPVPTGIVTIRKEGINWGAPQSLQNGAISWLIQAGALAIGDYALDFTYTGDQYYEAATSPAVTLQVITGPPDGVSMNWPYQPLYLTNGFIGSQSIPTYLVKGGVQSNFTGIVQIGTYGLAAAATSYTQSWNYVLINGRIGSQQWYFVPIQFTNGFAYVGVDMIFAYFPSGNGPYMSGDLVRGFTSWNAAYNNNLIQYNGIGPYAGGLAITGGFFA